MFAQFFDVLVGQNLGHVQVHHVDYPGKQSMYDTVEDGDALLAKIEETAGVNAATGRLFGFALLGGEDEAAEGARLIGVHPARETAVTHIADRVESGAWLAEKPAATVVLGEGLAKSLHAKVGTELVVMTQGSDGMPGSTLLTVTGVVRTGSTVIDKGGAFVHLADLQELLVLPGQLHEVLLTARDTGEIDAVSVAVDALREGDLVRTWYDASPQTADLMAMQDASAGIMFAIIFAVASLGVLNTMLMAVFERTRELGVMRAIGLKRRQLMALVLTESALLGVMSVTGGVVVGGLLDLYLVLVGVDFSTGSGQGVSSMGVTLDPIIFGVVRAGPVVAIAVMVLLVCVLAAVWPAMRAARLEPVEAMRQV
jgi:ABC-type lipoprotein release transport system permease subunit